MQIFLHVFNVRRALAAALLMGMCGVLCADEVSDGIDTAKIKDRAGRPEEALKAVEALLARHGADARVLYHLALFLQKLDRNNEAADAIEKAVAAAGNANLAEEDAPALRPLEKPIRQLAETLLEYRAKVRARLASFRESALRTNEKLLASEKSVWACYIIENLRALTESEDAQLAALRGRIEKSRWDAYRGLMRRPYGSGTQPTDAKEAAQLVKSNLALAEKQLRDGSHDEARLSARAVLEIEPDNIAALVLLSQAFAKLKRENDSVAAAVQAIDAPKTRAARAVQTQAFKAVRAAVADLEKYFADRSTVVEQLLTLREQALQKKRSHDARFIEAVLSKLAPGDPGVGDVIGVAKAWPPPGFIDLMDQVIRWEWTNKGPGSGRTDKELVLTNAKPGETMAQVSCAGRPLSARFVLRFEMRYDLDKVADAPIWLTFSDGRRPCALFCVPDGLHNVGFARLGERGWGIGARQPLPEGKPVAGQWFRYEITWDGGTRKLTLTVDGLKAFEEVLEADDDLSGIVAFSFCQGNALHIRNVCVKDQK